MRPIARSSRFRKIAKGAGTIMLGLIALDLVASVVTLAFGWRMFKG